MTSRTGHVPGATVRRRADRTSARIGLDAMVLAEYQSIEQYLRDIRMVTALPPAEGHS